MSGCSTNWAAYLTSLKTGAEGTIPAGDRLRQLSPSFHRADGRRRWCTLGMSPGTPAPQDSVDTRQGAACGRAGSVRRPEGRFREPICGKPICRARCARSFGVQLSPVSRDCVLKVGNIVNIDKAEIVATLRARGLDARADWVDRELPDLVDTYKNGALLRMLDIDPAAIHRADGASQRG